MKTLRFFLSSAVLGAFAVGTVNVTAWAAAPDLKDKVILANPEKYQVTLRIGGSQRLIQSRKASVLSPKRYPLDIEFWSGNARAGWKKTPVTSAGVFDFRWRGGQWTLLRRPPRAATATRPTAYRSPTYRRSTGSYPRTLRSPRYVARPPVYRGGWVSPRWPLWCRGVWGLATLYRFIRDEEDRDLVRDIIIGGEIDDAIRDEIEDALRDRLVALPLDQQRELEHAIDDISRLNPDDWKDITTLPADDWDRLRGDIGGEIDDADWEGLGNWVDTMDEPIGGDIDLGDTAIDTMDENIDLGDLDAIADTMDLDGAEETLDLDVGQDIQDIDLGDIAGGADTLDLSDFDDAGYQGGLDLGDVGAGDIDVGDADLGGGWGSGGFDLDPGGYDAGGFDNWGGGGDFGGGFDGGGLDFGGGFDDFGGGGDFFDF